jgi:hypothetical protein
VTVIDSSKSLSPLTYNTFHLRITLTNIFADASYLLSSLDDSLRVVSTQLHHCGSAQQLDRVHEIPSQCNPDHQLEEALSREALMVKHLSISCIALLYHGNSDVGQIGKRQLRPVTVKPHGKNQYVLMRLESYVQLERMKLR